MRILFVHQNFPGQFVHLAGALAEAGHQVVALAIRGRDLPGVRLCRYAPAWDKDRPHHPLSDDFTTKVVRGESCAAEAAALKRQGFTPDLIIAHPGWGESLFLKDVWPAVPLLALLEFYYHPRGVDVGFDPEFARSDWRDDARVRVKNAHLALTLDHMDAGYSPTAWQKRTHPAVYHDRIEVIHDGIDTRLASPHPHCALRLKADGRVFRPGDEILTYVARSLEPCRGYHRFMRALPEIQRRRPEAVTLIVGDDDISYGRPPPGQSWRQIFLDEVKDRLDLSRVFFLGTVPHADFLTVLRVSACHVYLTYPFVLSWSMIEAMSTGCVVVGSAVPPVEEVIEDRVNGFLVDFFDSDQLAETVAEALAKRAGLGGLRQAARATAVGRYDLAAVCLPRQLRLVERMLG